MNYGKKKEEKKEDNDEEVAIALVGKFLSVYLVFYGVYLTVV